MEDDLNEFGCDLVLVGRFYKLTKNVKINDHISKNLIDIKKNNCLNLYLFLNIELIKNKRCKTNY